MLQIPIAFEQENQVWVFDNDFFDEDIIKLNENKTKRRDIILIFLERLSIEKGTFTSGILAIGKSDVGKWSIVTCECLEKDTFVYLSIKKKQPKAFFGMEYG